VTTQLGATGVWLLASRPAKVPAEHALSLAERESWRMPPLAFLSRPEWSPGRKAAILALRLYLAVAVILLIVKAVQLALGA
jgi:hypothetical protein